MYNDPNLADTMGEDHYDAGQYSRDETSMIVSRGIGNSLLPFRIHNRPEVILIELRAKPI